MGENLDKYPIKDHVKRREKEKKGTFVGVELLSGDKIFGIVEETRPNVLVIRDKENSLKDIHRALVKRYVHIIDGGANG